MMLFSPPSRVRTLFTLLFAPALLSTSLLAEDPPWSYDLILDEVRSIDGSGNSNYYGGTDTPLLRMAPAIYPGDGSGEEMMQYPDRENPRTISNRIAAQGNSHLPNARKLTDYLWAWGQFLDHDIDLTEAHDDNGFADIEIVDENDPLGPYPILFSRSNYDHNTGTEGNPRAQVNEITAFVDASNVYGSDEYRAHTLRTFVDGQLKTGDHHLLPFNNYGLPNAGGPSPALFLAGDVRANENAMLSSIHTLFVREHNRLATLIKLHAPEASDDDIYYLARKIVGAEVQLITYQEFLPALLGPYAPSLSSLGYDPSVDPSIANEFSTAFYRFGHSLLSPELVLSDDGRRKSYLPLRDAFFRPDVLSADPHNVDRLLIGASLQVCQEVDTKVVDDVRNFLFGPPGAGGLDLAMLNIQRGRDHGLPDYNTLRVAYGLSPISSFDEISSHGETADALEELYGNVDNIDAWVGGLAEDHLPGCSVGETLNAALGDQFSRLMQGDRFSVLYDHHLDTDIVSAAIHLEEVTLANIIRANTKANKLHDDVFSIGRQTSADVIATYNELTNRLHITGNKEDNRLSIVETPFGFVISGSGRTRINGKRSTVFYTDNSPHICVDLGAGDDQMTTTFCRFADCVMVLGEGDDNLTTVFCRAERLAIDGGDGSDQYRFGYQTSDDKERLYNLN